MQVKAIEEVTERKEVVKRVECDKCGDPDVGAGAFYDGFECRLQIENGVHFPEGRDVETTSMDLCQGCADELKKLLTANGYRLNTEY